MADDVQVDATVTFEELTSDTFGVFDIPDDQTDAVWQDYFVENAYEKDGHTYMMGNTSPNPDQDGATVSFVQLATHTLVWICDWTAQRAKIKPDIPDPTSMDSNWVFLDEHFQAPLIEVAADGNTPIYRLSGTYFYGHVKPSIRTIDDINFPRPPWYDAGVFDQTVTSEMFDQTLSDIINSAVIQGGIKNQNLDTSDGLSGGVTQ